MNKKKLIRIVLMVIGIAVILYFLLFYISPRIFSRTRTSAGTLLADILSGDVDLEQQTGVLKSQGYKDNYFVADVVGVNESEKKLNIEINLVGSGGSYSVDDKTVASQCPQEKTTLASLGFGTLNEGVSLFDEVETGDTIWAYCLDEECTVIGKECILVKSEQ